MGIGLSFSGVHGKVTIPSIGLTVGEMESWSLKRREDPPPGAGEWDLRAVFSYINEHSFNSPKWQKVVIVDVGNPKKGGRQYQVDISSGTATLSGRSLLIQGVSVVSL